jgi:tungstate transport system substrate-binding protein
MHRKLLLTLLALVTPVATGLALPARPVLAQDSSMVLATTTSVYDTGLLDSLLAVFEPESGIHVKPIAVGSGAALDMARRGEADAVLVHDPAAERKAVARGDLIERRRIMHNDFLLVGPPADPAGARNATLREAMNRIALRARFISRGDGSGTESRERTLWALAGITPDTLSTRAETGQGQAATLFVASERGAYTLTDRGTWLSLRSRVRLAPIVEGDTALLNVYTAYVVNPAQHEHVRPALARAFVAFLASPKAQALIGRFGVQRLGGHLFIPDVPHE